MKEPKNLHESMLPLHMAANYFALNPVKFNENAQKYEVCKKCFAYCLIFGLISTFFISYVVEHAKLSEREVHSNTISQASFWFDLYAGIFIQITGILVSCINARTISRVMNHIFDIDRFVSSLGSKVSHKGALILCCSGLLCIFIEFLITAIPDYLFFSSATQTKVLLITSYITIITNGIVKLQFVVLVYIIFKRFQCVNTVLKKMQKTTVLTSAVSLLDVSHFTTAKRNPAAENVRKIHHIHNALCELCSYVNWLYGFQMLSIVGSAFNITISEFYYCYTVSKTSTEADKVLDIYFSIQWGLLQQMEIFAIVCFCVNLTNEAGKTIHHLHVLQHTSNNEELNESLKLFSLHEMHKSIKFTACGLFPLDFSLLLMIYAAVTSYLVIMIQYDMAKSTAANNV